MLKIGDKVIYIGEFKTDSITQRVYEISVSRKFFDSDKYQYQLVGSTIIYGENELKLEICSERKEKLKMIISNQSK